MLCKASKSQSEFVSRPESKCVKIDVKTFKICTPGEVLYPDDEAVSEVVISTNAKVKPSCIGVTLYNCDAREACYTIEQDVVDHVTSTTFQIKDTIV